MSDEIGPMDAIRIAKQVEADPGNSVGRVARIEVLNLADMVATGRRCLDCGAEIEACYWIQKCDPCLDALVEQLKSDKGER